MKCPDETQRTSQLEQLLEVLRILVAPHECQHISIERYFDDENRPPSDYYPCGMYCSYCTGSSYRSVGSIRKAPFYSYLVGHFLRNKSTPKSLMKLLRDQANNIFEPDSVPKSGSGWQALGLQLLALGIVNFDISEVSQSRIGTELLYTNHVIVTLGSNSIDMDGGPLMYDSDKWNWGGFHFV